MDKYDLYIYFLDCTEPVTATIKADSYEEAEAESQPWINKFQSVPEIDFWYYDLKKHIVS